MRTLTIKIVDSDMVILPGVGHVVGEVEYFIGSPGTYWDPPEPAEICDCDLRLVGDGTIENLFDREDVVEALESAVGQIFYRMELESCSLHYFDS